MYNLVLIPKRVFWRRGLYKSGHYRPANGTPFKCLFRWRADGGPIGLLCAGCRCDIPIFKNGVSCNIGVGSFSILGGCKASEANFNMGEGIAKCTYMQFGLKGALYKDVKRGVGVVSARFHGIVNGKSL